MKLIDKKTRATAFVSAVGLMVIGLVSTTSISAQETKMPIEVEVVPDREQEMIDQVANLTRKLQNKRSKNFPPQNGEVLRGVHPKSHGCVAASFTVLKYIGSDYQVGLFAKPGTYTAMIRYSNAAVLLEPDLKDGKNGSRGMAIKVLDVNGTILLPDRNRISGKIERNQDFLMINTPEFAFANVRDYLRLSRILLAANDSADLFFVPAKLAGLGPASENDAPGVKATRKFLENLMGTNPLFTGFTDEDQANTELSFGVVGKIQSQTVRNPLEVQYFSAAPFRFGPDRVMKFSVIPAAGEVPQLAFGPQEPSVLDDNYLALALKKSMAQGKAQGKAIRLSFMIQAVEKSQLAGRENDMIENAALAWSEEEFPFVKVADIVIDPAVQENKEFVDACKPLRFTPWHALAAHEPLGGINRLRKPVYCESGKFRPDGKDPKQVLCLGKEYK